MAETVKGENKSFLACTMNPTAAPVPNWLKIILDRGIPLLVHQYQIDGVAWCLKKETVGTICAGHATPIYGGILADEMGLGKTLQMLGTILSDNLQHPYHRTLIVLPVVLMVQWQKIFLEMLGQSVVLFHGPQKHKLTEADLLNAPIVLTTYGHAQKVNSLLQKVRWHRIILDEAHHIRNKDTKSYKGIFQVKSHVKWFLTGTPIQNNIADLHSLLQVLGVDSCQYNSPQKLKKTIKKFVLRRTKESIGLPLPIVRKPENIKIPWMLPSEVKYAAALHAPLQFSNVSDDEDEDEDEDDALDLDQAAAPKFQNKLALMVKARQMCIYPQMLKQAGKSKVQTVVSTLQARYGNGRSKIIFCHYKAEMDILQKELAQLGFSVQIIDGRTTDTQRAQILARQLPGQVLILQIQTCCEGLNLQHYSEVYFVSPHWNPAVEAQAIARCHRIGQEQEVEVFRFLMTWSTSDAVATPDDADKPKKRTLDEYAYRVQRKKNRLIGKTLGEFVEQEADDDGSSSSDDDHEATSSEDEETSSAEINS